MSKTMRRFGCLLIAWLLLAWSLCGAATADGLLAAMIDSALRSGRTIEATLRLDAADLLSSLETDAEGADAATVVAIGELLNNGLLRARYTKLGEQDVIGVALELRGKPVFTLDARSRDEEVALETSLLPGRTLIAPAEFSAQAVAAQLPNAPGDELLEALSGAAERYGAVFGEWAAQNEGVFAMSAQPAPATQKRDAAAQTATLRVTDAQALDLLRALARAFSEDDELREALAPQLGATPADLATMALQLADSLGAPKGSALEVIVYLGEADALVGIDARLEPAATSAESPGATQPAQGSVSYSHRSLESDRSADSIDADLSWGEDSRLQAQLSRVDKMPNKLLPNEGEDYGGRARLETPDGGSLGLEVSGSIVRTVEPVSEGTLHTFDLRVSQAAENADASDLASLLQAPLFEAGFTQRSQTDVVGSADFEHIGSFAPRLMGQTAAILFTLKSIEHTPEERPDNSLIQLDALSEAEADALTQELQQNAMLLLDTLLSPAEQPPAEADPDVLARAKEALDAGQPEEALAIYDTALAARPDIADYTGGRGEALIALGRYEEALVPLNAAMQAEPENWLHVNNRGVAYFFMGQLEQALADFEQGVALKPDHPDGYYNLAYVQRELGQTDSSVITCALGLTVFPDSDDLWAALGDVRYAIGDDQGALNAYNRAISFGRYTPEDIPPYSDLQQGAGG